MNFPPISRLQSHFTNFSFNGLFLVSNQTHIPCIDRQILYHWATREALFLSFLWLLFHYIYVLHLLIHLSVDEYFGCFHILAIVWNRIQYSIQWAVLLWTLGVHVSFRMSVFFVPDIHPGMELLNHMVVLFLGFWGNSILFSAVAKPTYILTNSVPGFPFLHILTNICYL